MFALRAVSLALLALSGCAEPVSVAPVDAAPDVRSALPDAVDAPAAASPAAACATEDGRRSPFVQWLGCGARETAAVLAAIAPEVSGAARSV